MSKDVVDRIRASKIIKACDETSSIASDMSTNYSLVRMTFFPIHVREVKDNWPESGRFRNAVKIDDALELMKSRPEFYAVLKEVKEKGIHLVSRTDAPLLRAICSLGRNMNTTFIMVKAQDYNMI